MSMRYYLYVLFQAYRPTTDRALIHTSIYDVQHYNNY